ncbi:MAG: response regulator transcription factor [Planctomycetota bacterium]|jgi:DNA-binding response OmpR family regulator
MSVVLVVEDDRDANQLLQTLVLQMGHDPIAGTTAEAALALVGDQAPSLAIIDILLPGAHGVSLAWQLKRRWRNLPIIVVSGNLQLWEADDIYDCGVTVLLEKPYDIAVLKRHIDALISNQQAAQTLDSLLNPGSDPLP